MAALVGDPNLQGRVIPYPGGLLFTAKLEEFSKFKFDLVVIAEENLEVVNTLINQFINAKVDLAKIRLFKDNQLLSINLKPYPPIAPKDRPKLLFDVSIDAYVFKKISNVTGIPRVLRNIYRNIDSITKHEILPIQWSNQGVITCNRYSSYLYDKEFDNKEYKIHFVSDDKIFLADSIWCKEPQYYFSLAEETEKGNLITFAFIHDLIPIRYSKYHTLSNGFTNYIHCALKSYTAFICNSKTTAEDVISYFKEQNFHRDNPLNIYYCHLGFEIENKVGDVRLQLKDFVSKSTTFLMVGTVEARKNHITVLRAFKNIIEQHSENNIQLLIIGRADWLIEEVNEFLSQNQHLKEKMLWLQDASDSELHWAYQNTEALILASLAEGFGLPIVEAAHFKLPVICSDIPIFHEVAGDNAVFFDPHDDEVLKNILLNWQTLKSTVDSSKIRLYTWNECAQEILDIMNGKTQPYKVLK